ncbi:hypothetical protein [Coleofasciculus sp. FACHB-SPT36]|uniref:hypothetical protein n=1 Tax=Cyanophyceae TaxID=3028117 RepID=UPI00168B16AE|nr:hypothetical protein [Coleofasciculus sp. FACHB-SPT36]MBD2539918.1 hypothetical protein [Coleofasciculus sp. FACHB-SPT36]
MNPNSIHSSTVLESAKPSPAENVSKYAWYLGIDFGTTGVSAVLLNGSTGERYPIYWISQGQTESTQTSFRLPAVTYTGPAWSNSEQSSGGASSAYADTPAASNTYAHTPAAIAVGVLASSLANRKEGVFIQGFKPYLKVGIPYYSSAKKWEPILQWSLDQPISLYWLGRSLQALFATLRPLGRQGNPLSPTEQSRPNLVGAAGLKPSTLNAAMSCLSGVIVGCPAKWGDTYRFNIREAVLGAHLVENPEEIFFLEDAIATLLAGIEGATLPGVPWQGGTLVIDAGATTIELAVVNLPENLKDLTYSQFACRSLAYAGNAIDQDIIGQLLLNDEEGKMKDEFESSFILHSSSLSLPKAGEPDLATRDRLASLLQSSPLGQALLEAANSVKRILQQQDSYTVELGGKSCLVTRRDLENRVFKPFLEKLNQELNALLTQAGIPASGIHQIICTGGTAAVGEIAQWLRQKLPKAVLIRDTGANDSTLNCSPVAYGLATLPLYPQLLEQQTQQYSDYFLLLELLRALPEEPLPLNEIMQLLEYRGINTRVCYSRVMALLEGKLPAGIVPSEAEFGLLSSTSEQNPDYQAIAEAPLFEKEATQMYRLNAQQGDRYLRYLNTILTSTYQKLEEPLVFDLLVPATV